MKHLRAAYLLAILSLCIGGGWHNQAQASRGGAEVIITQAKLPDAPEAGKKGKSFNLLAFAKQHRATFLSETQEADLKSRKWVARLVVGFARPPAEPEMNLVYYDVQGGQKNYLTSQTLFLRGSQTEKSFLNTIKLYRDDFPPNHKIEMIVTMGQTEVGRTTFTPKGVMPKRNNNIDFTKAE